jgi:hypothetical protein
MRGTLISLLVAACAGMGCVSLPSWWEKPKPAPPSPVVKPATPRPVTAEQITEGNARQMADRLLHEMDRDGQTEAPALSDTPSSPR